MTAGPLINPDANQTLPPVHRWVTIPLAMCLVGALCFAIDIPVAAYFQSKQLPKLLIKIFSLAEVFAHGAGVILIVVAVAVVNALKRKQIMLLLVGSLGAGLTADVIKLSITRVRPRNVDLAKSTVWETFGPWLPLSNHTNGDSHSFPSGHTATAFGFAVVLSALYPRGRWVFFTFACLASLQRMESLAHFTSDVCFGAAVGWVMGNVALHFATRDSSVPAVAEGV